MTDLAIPILMLSKACSFRKVESSHIHLLAAMITAILVSSKLCNACHIPCCVCLSAQSSSNLGLPSLLGSLGSAVGPS